MMTQLANPAPRLRPLRRPRRSRTLSGLLPFRARVHAESRSASFQARNRVCTTPSGPSPSPEPLG